MPVEIPEQVLAYEFPPPSTKRPVLEQLFSHHVTDELQLMSGGDCLYGPQTEVFPTLAEVERATIVAAYQRSNRKPLEAARLLGIGKTTLYRKLREIREAAA